MKWIKGHTSELDSTLYEEADIEIRYVFYALRLLAGRENKAGKIKYLDSAHLGRLLNTKTEIIEKSLKFLEKTKRIKIKQISEGHILNISKWKIYQGDTRSKMESQTYTQSRSRVDYYKNNTKSGAAEETAPHFDTRFEFLKRLRILEEDLNLEHEDDKNKQLFEYLLKTHPRLDPIRELDSIITLWKKSPGELEQRLKRGVSLQHQLYKLFNEAAKYAGVK